jgi:hypothetical protein
MDGRLPKDLEDLIDLGVSGEERFAGAHFSKDSTARPHVDPSRVLAATEKDLRGTVPERHDLHAKLTIICQCRT